MQRVIEITNYCRKFLIDPESILELFRRLDFCEKYKIPDGDLSIAFVSKQRIKDLHYQFFSDNSCTDVITFLGDTQFNSTGEIVVSPDYALSRLKEFNTSLEQEVTLYLIHGFLHLAGLKDKSPDDVIVMRAAEKYCLEFVNQFPIDIHLKH